MSVIERDNRFYMTFVTIQVDDCLFRLPRQLLAIQSKIFGEMFSLPATGDAEGSSDDNPIRLDGITKFEFQYFLEVLFTNVGGRTLVQLFEGPREMVLPWPGWLPVVKLAQMWECHGIHRYTINRMPYEEFRMSPAEKVGFAVRYDIHPWLIPGVNELAQRKEPLGSDDLAHLGPELLLKVAAVRESVAASVIRSYQGTGASNAMNTARLIPGTRDASAVDFTEIIKRVFQLPG